MGLAEMKVQKLVLGVQILFYNGYLSHQCKFPMLPLFKTSFKLTYFFLNLVSLYPFYYL